MIGNPEVIRSRWSGIATILPVLLLVWIIVGHPGMSAQQVIRIVEWPTVYVMRSIPEVPAPLSQQEKELLWSSIVGSSTATITGWANNMTTGLLTSENLSWGSGVALSDASGELRIYNGSTLVTTTQTIPGFITIGPNPRCKDGEMLKWVNDVWTCAKMPY